MYFHSVVNVHFPNAQRTHGTVHYIKITVSTGLSDVSKYAYIRLRKTRMVIIVIIVSLRPSKYV